MTAPAIFAGIQDGFRKLPPIELYTLLAPVGDHPAGSTVSRSTLESHGFNALPQKARRKNRRRAGPKAG